MIKLTQCTVRLLAASVIALLACLLWSSPFAFANGGNTHANNTLRAAAARLGLHVGSAVSYQALSTDPAYAKVLGQQFSAITPENEMKWGPLEPERGVFNFAPADAEVQFALQHHQLVRGHNLVWHSQLPDWLTSGSFTNAQLSSLLKQHIFTEVGHFRGKIWQWDVVNEPFNEDGSLRSTIWSTALGVNYIADVLKWAHKADPHAKLYLNDYNIEGIGAKSDGMYALARSLKQQHVPLDGIGFETHLDLQFNLPPMIKENFQRFANLGLEVAITEMDVRMPLPVTPEKLDAQANVYAQLMQDCIAVRQCVDITIWEYTDKYSWVPGFFIGEGAADIYDENLAPKPAYTALLAALKHPVSHRPHDTHK